MIVVVNPPSFSFPVFLHIPGGPAAPPPPPISSGGGGGRSGSGGPPPPPPPSSSSGGGGGGGSRAGPPPPPAKAASNLPAVNAERGSLLADIRAGKKLKKHEVRVYVLCVLIQYLFRNFFGIIIDHV